MADEETELYARTVVSDNATQQTFTSNHRPVIVYLDQVYVTLDRRTSMFDTKGVAWLGRADPEALVRDKTGAFLDVRLNHRPVHGHLAGVFTSPDAVMFQYTGIDTCVSYGSAANISLKAATRPMHVRARSRWGATLSELALRRVANSPTPGDIPSPGDQKNAYYTVYDDDVDIEFRSIAHVNHICHGNVFHVEIVAHGAWTIHLVGWVFKGTGVFYAPRAPISPVVTASPLCVSLLAITHVRPHWTKRAWNWFVARVSRVSSSRATGREKDTREASHAVEGFKVWAHGDQCAKRIHSPLTPVSMATLARKN